MKNLLLAAIAGTALVAAGPALAGKGNMAGGPGHNKGNQGCTLADGSTYKNPGKMLQFLSDRDGNPKATVDRFPNSFANVGELISIKCTPPVD